MLIARHENGKIIEINGKKRKNVIFTPDMSFKTAKENCENTFHQQGEFLYSFYKIEGTKRNIFGHPIIFNSDWEGKEQINKIVVFGDSLSDNGNLYKRSLGVGPRTPYWKGRFSDGPVWNELLAQALNIQLVNQAFGASVTSHNSDYLDSKEGGFTSSKIGRLLVPTGFDQVKNFLNSETKTASNIYLINLGAVNYLSVAYQKKFIDLFAKGERLIFDKYVQYVVHDLKKIIKKIISKGGIKIILLNLGDMKKIPVVENVSEKTREILVYLSEKHNIHLSKMVDNLKFDTKPKIFNYWDLTAKILNNYKDYGISEPQKPCFLGGPFGWDKEKDFLACERHNFAFFDWGHPTAKVQCIMAHQMFQFLTESFNFSEQLLGVNRSENWQKFCPHIVGGG